MLQQFKFQPSRYLAAILIAAHVITIAALFPLALSTWAKTALASIMLFSLAYHLRRDAFLSSPSSSAALALEGDQVVLITRAGERLAGKILHDSIVTPFLTVLNMLPQGARLAHSVVILPDSLDAESFRKIRVYLKWGSSLKRQPFA